ncbi:MAG: hypothetical protein PHG64_15250, partial [Paludibacter sp.]|nr:hypothetical protein [Paludibacter sp.]
MTADVLEGFAPGESRKGESDHQKESITRNRSTSHTYVSFMIGNTPTHLFSDGCFRQNSDFLN